MKLKSLAHSWHSLYNDDDDDDEVVMMRCKGGVEICALKSLSYRSISVNSVL